MSRNQPDGFPAPSSPIRLRVSTAAETALRSRHPWLFADSIREQSRPGQSGELAVIYDKRDQFLALGLFDPDSPIRVRILHAGKPVKLTPEWWQSRFQDALGRRAGMLDEGTTGFRLIHGESDGWPGLVLDRYGSALVVKLYTAAWLPRLEALVELIRNASAPEHALVLRLSRNIQTAARLQFQREDGQILAGQIEANPVVFLESGLQFEADVRRGQKTGFFLDQRENRRVIETFSQGRAVLNAFSFSGGFSIYAARGGASSVTDLDISPHALASSERNWKRNLPQFGSPAPRHETIQANAFDWLRDQTERRFDLIILDPPSLAKREAEKAEALAAYFRLAQSGLALLRPGGILAAASCSAHIKTDEFFEQVRLAAARSRRAWTELQTTRHPPDHPASFPEAEYLKCIYLRLG